MGTVSGRLGGKHKQLARVRVCAHAAPHFLLRTCSSCWSSMAGPSRWRLVIPRDFILSNHRVFCRGELLYFWPLPA